MEMAAFIVLSVLALVSALVVITHRNAVIAALALAFNLISIAGFFFLLGAQFVGFLQIIVYAGAIMVLIMFVLMLLNIRDEQRMRGARGIFQRMLGPIFGGAFAGLVLLAIRESPVPSTLPEAPADFGTVGALGRELFTRFFYPFEAISLLLVVAMIGAVLLAKRRL
jgi:NADH-quinone oxidoreductase subunit J